MVGRTALVLQLANCFLRSIDRAGWYENGAPDCRTSGRMTAGVGWAIALYPSLVLYSGDHNAGGRRRLLLRGIAVFPDQMGIRGRVSIRGFGDPVGRR